MKDVREQPDLLASSPEDAMELMLDLSARMIDTESFRRWYRVQKVSGAIETFHSPSSTKERAALAAELLQRPPLQKF